MDQRLLAQSLSIYLEQFEWTIQGEKANFRCPLCGDSKKDPNKKRGWFTTIPGTRDIIFKCFNCNRTRSLENFARDFNMEVYRAYKFDQYRGDKDVEDFNVKKLPETVSYKPPLEDFCVSMRDLDDTHLGKIYLRNRGLSLKHVNRLFWCDNFNGMAKNFTDSVKSDSEKSAIVMPLMSRNKELFGFQGRYLEGEFRYKTVMFDKTHIKSYGQNFVKDGDINVTEGVFDCMFLENGLAALDGDLASTCDQLPFDNERFVLWFDLEPHNKHVMEAKEKAVNMGFRVAFMDNELRKLGKDLNSIMLADYSKETLNRIRSSTVESGLKAKLLLARERA